MTDKSAFLKEVRMLLHEYYLVDSVREGDEGSWNGLIGQTVKIKLK